uniref:PH domain-containing protein n=1 Tax=Coccolithus braarudii TaxID=221442 RepID=A0A7S0L854_9EUKA|mmetsp:Transcript_23389/g.50488  ORF Transcript_23389/g.50488 Transcript_23389/m.50488 type:complete len:241 (+) Transcript_23389:80-802(+)|eukprot:CAMPEP_0183378800 /NCGR_PEP_ID=MMETSP0164_2-20130417/125103_1 /TAXON_ID=221442 /ORGANISM="Coccolithus pelagicus ssp braarudi, Strain PLY182g" /LENGTH=240 /DNA_ID=CAMNT_0025556373 /DNA_START=64 /DNA_END=786 /DNA_ORIENTATION=-
MAAETAPDKLQGFLYKKSPAGPIYQKRLFTAENGSLSYEGGRHRTKALPLIDIERITQTCKMRLEFSVVFRVVDSATTSHTEFAFRAEDREALALWTQGLGKHIDYEKRRADQTFTADGGSLVPQERKAQKAAKHLDATFSKQSMTGELLFYKGSVIKPWQKREVTVVGPTVLYSKKGGGWQNAISLLETKTITINSTTNFEFELRTHHASFKFRATDRAEFYRWVNGLQQAHQKLTSQV